MAPSAITELAHTDVVVTKSINAGTLTTTTDVARNGRGLRRTVYLMDRHLHKEFPVVVGGKGNYMFTADGRQIFDASGGAAVSCLGHGNERVNEAVYKQMNSGISYLAAVFWASDVVDELCKEMIDGTGGKMARVYLTGSGLHLKTHIS